jgi:hypothetical protein
MTGDKPMKLYAYIFNGDYQLFTDFDLACEYRESHAKEFPFQTGDFVFAVMVNTGEAKVKSKEC